MQKRAFESGRPVSPRPHQELAAAAVSVHPRPSASEVRDLAGQSSDPQPGVSIPHGFRWAN